MNLKFLRVAAIGFLSAMFCFSALAESAKPAVAPKTKPAASEADVRKALETMTPPGAIESIRKAGYGGFYEVVLSNGEIVYVDDTASFFFTGSLIDIANRKDVTEARNAELSRINFAELPLNQAIKVVHGNGKRVVATFEDPNCVFCKKLAKELKGLNDTTIYTFLIPILGGDSPDKTRNIWCATDPAKTWTDWMQEGKAPANVAAKCDTGSIDKNLAMARKYRVNGTPTIFLADGTRLGGYVPLDRLEKAMTDASDAAKQAKK